MSLSPAYIVREPEYAGALLRSSQFPYFFGANLCHALVTLSTYSEKIEGQGNSMEANPNNAAVRDAENFSLEGGSGDDAPSQITEFAIATVPGVTTRPFASSHRLSASVDEQYQPFSQSNSFSNEYEYPHSNSWQPNSVPIGGDHSHPSETDIGQTDTPYIDVNGNIAIDRTAYFNGNGTVQDAVDWSVSDAPSPAARTTVPPR